MNTIAAADVYRVIAPEAAYVMACIGGALGLRCVNRALLVTEGGRAGWLALGAASLGCGVWTMHFVALTGFRVPGARIGYDLPLAAVSLAVAIAVFGIAFVVIARRGATPRSLTAVGVLTGLGIAAMHRTGMAAIRMQGHLEYRPAVVALSVLVAVAAATVALWTSVSVHTFAARCGAVLLMGFAMTGTHYTGIAAVIPHADRTAAPPPGLSPASLLFPMLIGPVLFLILATAVVLLDPLLVLGKGDWSRPSSPRDRPA